MKKLLGVTLMLICVALFTACGGGTQTLKAGTTMKAVIKQTALTANMNIAGIDLTITLPPGVSPPLKTNGTVDASATVEITSSSPQGQTLPGATYTPTTATTSGQLAISAIVASGFTATDQITLHLNVAPGSIPVESDFRLLLFNAFDTNGAPVLNLSPSLTTTIQ